jgi:hypothetical protein
MSIDVRSFEELELKEVRERTLIGQLQFFSDAFTVYRTVVHFAAGNRYGCEQRGAEGGS